MAPFLTFYTPTYRRPEALRRCMASVAMQTARDQVEHLLIADYVGIGIAGVYAQVLQYTDAVHGEYVHILADDDELSNPSVVAQLRDFAEAEGMPAVILVTVIKEGHGQIDGAWPPAVGQIDLGNLVIRRDVWQRHANAWGKRYEGDGDMAVELYRLGYEAKRLQLLFLIGGVRHGQPEVAA